MKKTALTGTFEENRAAVKAALNIPRNEDIITRAFTVGGRDALLFYVDGMADDQKIERFVMTPLLRAGTLDEADLAASLLNTLPAASLSETTQTEGLVSRVMSGDAALLLDGLSGAVIADVKGFEHRAVADTVNESVVVGPQEGFNESLRDNIVLMRRILRSPQMISERLTVGSKIPVRLSMVYLSGVAREDIVSRVRERIEKCNVDYLSSAGMLEQLLEDRPYSLLPQIAQTERPDRAASFLNEGQVLVFVENASCALSMPIDLLHLYHAPDDTGMRWQYGTFIRVLRLIGILMSLFLPALFVALTMHHLEGLSLALVTSVGKSQADVPFSLFISTFLMLIIFSIINEAATRVPGAMGTSLSIVGGLILGTAAVEADTVSPLVIIVVALAGIGSFAVPDYPLTIALRITQLALVIAAQLMGYLGLALAAFFFLVRLMTLTSLGAPYFAPVSPVRPANPDRVIRFPIWRQRLRGFLAAPGAMKRVRGRMRGWEGEDDA